MLSAAAVIGFLTFSTLGKIFCRRHSDIEIFSYFSRKHALIFQANCRKCQILFSGKNKENITNLSSAESAQSVVKVTQLAFFINLQRAIIGPSVTLTGR